MRTVSFILTIVDCNIKHMLQVLQWTRIALFAGGKPDRDNLVATLATPTCWYRVPLWWGMKSEDVWMLCPEKNKHWCYLYRPILLSVPSQGQERELGRGTVHSKSGDLRDKRRTLTDGECRPLADIRTLCHQSIISNFLSRLKMTYSLKPAFLKLFYLWEEILLTLQLQL